MQAAGVWEKPIPIQLTQRFLGKGTFGTVVLGAAKNSCEALVVKSGTHEDLAGEARCLADLKHPNVVQFQGVYGSARAGELLLALEYAARGSLFDDFQVGGLSVRAVETGSGL